MQDSAHQLPDNTERPTLAHVAPFIAWLFIAHMLGDPEGWKYAIRSAVCLGLFIWLRPWRWYPRLNPRNLPLAGAVGIAVLIAWVIGETPWMAQHLPLVHELYVKYGILPLGEMREPMTSFPYAPDATGWPLTMTRILGSAFVIGIIEEFFWRGWLYRWMQGRNFLKVDHGAYERIAFFAVAFVFGLEHKEWLAGFAAGLAYGWLYIRTRDIWATALAHALTNFALGWYVLWADAYQFWS